MAESIIELALSRPTGFSLQATFSLKKKGVTVLFGPSGCGKTSILRAVAGLEKACGRVVVGGNVWQDDESGVFVPTHKRSLGYIFQEPSLFSHLSVEENLKFGFKRKSIKTSIKRMNEAVELLGIGSFLDRRESELSGGEKQRVAIARSIAMNPEILLMDEPLSALDWKRKREILPWLEKLKDELNIPILYVTHSFSEMSRLADEIILMDSGRVKFSGPFDEALSSLEQPFKIGDETCSIMMGRVVEKNTYWSSMVVEADGIRFELPDSGEDCGSSVRIKIRARDVSLSIDEPSRTSIRNHFKAVVLDISPSEGAHQLVKLSTGASIVLASLMRRSIHELGITRGAEVWAQIKSVAVVN